jgi:predicted pyridoxine 5'-phosphate oxidase superfamily flavin-nucleotide-binding protein
MAHRFLDLAFTPEVLAAQQHYYGRAQTLPPSAEDDVLGPNEIEFIQRRDSFYLASVSSTGWPYVQHRGGPPGFLRVLPSGELLFADFHGNRQMLTTGNVATNDRVCLFLMDYPRRERLKIFGHASVLDAREHPDLVETIAPTGLEKAAGRLVRIHVSGFDWNCPKYITPRHTSAEVEAVVAPLRARIAELEVRLAQE